MAAYNKRLGTFELTGLPPAPRGVPQIEVTFDIDANGTVHVNAKDLGTGKEQPMTSTGGSALPQDDIERMMRDAQHHAEQEKSRRGRPTRAPGAPGSGPARVRPVARRGVAAQTLVTLRSSARTTSSEWRAPFSRAGGVG